MNVTERHFRIDLGYDGTEFFGSQRQREVRTVQLVVEDALSRLANHPVRIALAGRTDRGVHAVGQVASGTLRWRRDVESLRYALDSLTPDDVSITAVHEVPTSFHARYDAISREYRYRVWNARSPAVLARRFVWHVRADLNLDRMNEATVHLIGQKDFASFAGAGLGVPGTAADCVRNVLSADWQEIDQRWERGTSEDRILEFCVRADRFLPHMVRNMVGNLIEVGRGARSVDWLASTVAKRDRRCAESAAPPQGLVFWSVEYPEGSQV